MNTEAILRMLKSVGTACKITAPDDSYRISTVGAYSTTDDAPLQSNGNAINLAQPALVQVQTQRFMYVAAGRRAPQPGDVVTIGKDKRRIVEVLAYSQQGKDVAYKLKVS